MCDTPFCDPARVQASTASALHKAVRQARAVHVPKSHIIAILTDALVTTGYGADARALAARDALVTQARVWANTITPTHGRI